MSNLDLGWEEPLAHCELPDWPDYLDDILPPTRVNGNFQCAVPTSDHGVFLLSIPDQHRNPSSTHNLLSCSHVYSGRLGGHRLYCSPFGLRYCLVFEQPMSSPGWTFIPYQDSLSPQRHILSTQSESQTVVDHAYTIHGARQVILDPYLHRVVGSNLRTFFFVDLTPSSVL